MELASRFSVTRQPRCQKRRPELPLPDRETMTLRGDIDFDSWRRSHPLPDPRARVAPSSWCRLAAPSRILPPAPPPFIASTPHAFPTPAPQRASAPEA